MTLTRPPLHPSVQDVPGALPRDTGRFRRLATEPEPVLDERADGAFAFVSSLETIPESSKGER